MNDNKASAASSCYSVPTLRFLLQPIGRERTATAHGQVLLHAPLDIEAQWKELEQALAQNLTRAIGISNFDSKQAKLAPCPCMFFVESHDPHPPTRLRHLPQCQVDRANDSAPSCVVQVTDLLAKASVRPAVNQCLPGCCARVSCPWNGPRVAFCILHSVCVCVLCVRAHVLCVRAHVHDLFLCIVRVCMSGGCVRGSGWQARILSCACGIEMGQTATAESPWVR